MRVTHVITRLIVGGAQENTVASVLGLQQRTPWDIRLVSGPASGPEGSLAPALNGRPGTLTLLPSLVRPINPWNDCLALRRLTAIFRETRPDLVHTHSGKAGILGRLAASRAGVPIIVHTVHGPSFGPFQNAAANALFRAAERAAGRVTTHFITVADSLTAQYLKAGIGTPERYTKILSGFDLRPFLSAEDSPDLRARWGIRPDDIVIGKIARLFKLKGHDDLLRVAPRLARDFPQIKFLLVGDGEWRGRIQRGIRRLGLQDRFVLTGLVMPEEIPGLVGIMDFVAHLSRREGLPRALPQALAAGKPVAAYDCDGAAEVCVDHKTGFLIPPGDLSQLANRLHQLAGDPELRRTLGFRGRALVKEQFDLNRMISALQELYIKLARARNIPVE